MNKKSTIILYAFIAMTILAIGISGTCISKEFIKISQKFNNLYNIQNTQENSIQSIEHFQLRYKKLLIKNKYKKLLKRAEYLIHQDKLSEAMKILDNVISLDANNQLAYYLRGIIKFSLKDWDGSVNDFNAAEKLGNTVLEDMYLYRAYDYLQLGLYEKAINDSNVYISHNPNNALSYINRSLSYLKLNNINQSLKDLLIAYALYDEAAGENNKDELLEYINLLSEDYKNKKQKISELFPQIDKNFDIHYFSKNEYYVFYIDPNRWASLSYKKKIELFHEAVLYSMLQEILNKNYVYYSILKHDVIIRSSIDGTILIKRMPNRGKQEKIFKNNLLQEISQNHRLTPAYVKQYPTTQDELLNAYLDKVSALFEDNTSGQESRSFKITVNRKGKIKEIVLQDPPWKDGVDDQAVKIIRSLEPYPPIPDKYNKDFIEINELIKVDTVDF